MMACVNGSFDTAYFIQTKIKIDSLTLNKALLEVAKLNFSDQTVTIEYATYSKKEIQVQFVKYLIEIGADPLHDNNSIIRKAIRSENLELVDFLISKGASVKQCVTKAFSYGNTSILDQVQNFGLGVDAQFDLFKSEFDHIENSDNRIKIMTYFKDHGFYLDSTKN